VHGKTEIQKDLILDRLTMNYHSLTNNKSMVIDHLILNGGQLAGNGTSGTVVVNGPIEWTGGGMSGTGVVTANGGIMISGSNYKYLYRPLNNANNQTAVYSGSNWNIGINVAIGVFNNLAGSTFEVHASTIGGYYTSAFNNEGTIVPVGIDKLTITPRFNNYGTLEIPNGELEVQGGGTSTNTLSVRHLNVNTGTLNIDPFVVDEGSTLNNVTEITVHGKTEIQKDLILDRLTMNYHSLTNNKSMVIDHLILNGGQLAGNGTSGTVVVNGPIEWTGGGMSGTGVVTANGGIMISGSNYKYLYRPLNNANNQTAVYSGSNWNIGINVAIGVFNNLAGSTFEVHASTIGGYYTSAFNNEGTIVPVGIDKLTITPRFNNYGTLEIPNGELEVQGGGTSTNTLSVRHLNVNTGTLNIDPFVVDEGSTLNNVTEITVHGKTEIQKDLILDRLTMNYHSLTNNKSMVIDHLILNGGQLAGNGTSGTVVVNGPIEWTGGGMSGTGVVTANGGIMISGSNYKYLYRPLNNANNQTAVYSGSNWNIGINVAIGVFNNLAGSTFEVHASTIGGYYTSAFNNEGTFLYDLSEITIAPKFYNAGTIDIQNKSLIANGGYTQTGGVTQLGGGTLTSPSTISIQGGELLGIGTINAHVINAGEISAGSPTGALTINGNLTFQDSASLSLDFEGQPAGATLFDHLKVNGNVILNGDLSCEILMIALSIFSQRKSLLFSKPQITLQLNLIISKIGIMLLTQMEKASLSSITGLLKMYR
jgi:hypothetical protein